MARFYLHRQLHGRFRFAFLSYTDKAIFLSDFYDDRVSAIRAIEDYKVFSDFDETYLRSPSQAGNFSFIVRDQIGGVLARSGTYETPETRDEAIEYARQNASKSPIVDESRLYSSPTERRLNDVIRKKDSSNEEEKNKRPIVFSGPAKFAGGSEVGDSYDQVVTLQQEISELQKQFQADLKKIQNEKEVSDAEYIKLKDLVREIDAKSELANILPRVNSAAAELLIRDQDFRNYFFDNGAIYAVVVSIDIRRSTELMLKAKTPLGYSKFITSLSSKLSGAIIENYGIFDKFTGDGILAFFPQFYSGPDAIIYALIASQQCHKIFQDHYSENKSIFNVFIKDIGLGIGIDFGEVTLVNNGSELTVVGVPVVYACRMSGTPAHTTILNQSAFDHIIEICGDTIHFEEKEIEIKHEGRALAYSVLFNEKSKQKPRLPFWMFAEDTLSPSNTINSEEILPEP